MTCWKCGTECVGAECPACSGEGSIVIFDSVIDFTKVKSFEELLVLLNAVRIVVNTEIMSSDPERFAVIRPYLVKQMKDGGP